MEYRSLGKTGLRVSELCLGAMTFGRETDEDTSYRMLDYFIESGGNFIDTANRYTEGTSEKYVGEFIAEDREHFVLGTKYTLFMRRDDPNACGNHRKNMVQSIEASLKRLGTDYIDLYWLHVWEYTTPIEEVMRAFDDLVTQGKVLYIGISDAPAWLISRANTMAELRGWTPFIGIQIKYNLIERTVERELLPMARELDLGVVAWGPLESGVLTGKYLKKTNSQDEERRRDNQMVTGTTAELDDRQRLISQTVLGVANTIGHSPSQVALNWIRRQPGLIIPLIGARRLSQLEDNLGCLEFTLEEEHVQKLDEVSQIELGFPHDFIQRESTQKFAFGGLKNQIDNHRNK